MGRRPFYACAADGALLAWRLANAPPRNGARGTSPDLSASDGLRGRYLDGHNQRVEAFGVIVVVVVLASLALGIWMARKPVPWDEYTQDLLSRHHDEPAGTMPTAAEDEAELRALIARKRAARGAAPREAPPSLPWSHIEPDVLHEARWVLERRAARFEREGRPFDLVAELTRLLGPPHP